MKNKIDASGYSVFFEDARFSMLKKFLRQSYFSRVFILVDRNTEKCCLPALLSNIPTLKKANTIVISSGEKYKNLTTLTFILESLSKKAADRNSLLINLGGGVVGDVGGFAASVYMRGIACIHLPTTLLAMADSSIGGKTGIDFLNFKNQIGTFYSPKAVFIYTEYLTTLDQNQLLSGFAEIIKSAIISDRKLWNLITRTDVSKSEWRKYLFSSVSIKNKIVRTDFLEKGERKILNFGHTIGHAVESFYLGKKDGLLHGEAVAIGMICETFISERLGLISKMEMQAIHQFISVVFKRKKIDLKNFQEILRFIKNDKKNSAGAIRMALPIKIGKCTFDIEVNEDLIFDSIQFYNVL